MKQIFILFLFLGITTKSYCQQNLLKKADYFNVSECKYNCHIDSIGIKTKKIIDNELLVKFGYVVNCSWKEAYLSKIKLHKNNLFIELDRPHDIDTLIVDSETTEITEIYPLTDCDCFFYFDLKIKDFNKLPDSIKVSSRSNRHEYWSDLKKHDIEIIETVIPTK